MFGRATITLGIGPHSSIFYFYISNYDVLRSSKYFNAYELEENLPHTVHAPKCASAEIWPGTVTDIVECHAFPLL